MGPGWRVLRCGAALALAVAAVPASAAARVLTWDDPGVSQSRFVDPMAMPGDYFNEPPGVPERTNALKVNVYLPPGYATRPDRSYPVLYLLHGHGDSYDSWVNQQQGDLLRTAAGFRGVIIMPEGDHGWYTNWWNGGRRGDPAWERYHLDQLIPLVERRLRIRGGRRWHAIAGLSMGGEGAIYYASQRPGYFGSAASFSGVVSIRQPEYQAAFTAFNGEPKRRIWGDPQDQSFYWRGHDPLALVDNLRNTRVFVSVGDGVPAPDEAGNTFGVLAEADLRLMAIDFVGAARRAGVDLTYHPHRGIHVWRYWRDDLERAIRWGFFRKPSSAGARWTYGTVASAGEMWGMRFRFEQPPKVLESFERDGRLLTGDGAGEVTITSPGGCASTLRLPFRLRLRQPSTCLSRQRQDSSRAR